MATVQVNNFLTSRSPRVMALLRAFTLVCLCNNILFHARHMPGVGNRITDTLSQQQMERFHQLTLEADHLPVPFSWDLWRIGGLRLTG